MTSKGNDRRSITTTGSWPDGRRFRFPCRDLGRARWVVFVPILGSVVLVAWLVGVPIAGLIQKGPRFGTVLMLVLKSVIAVPVCRFPLWHGLALLFGHTEIHLQTGSLSAGERVGWLSLSKEWPLHRFRRIQVFDLFPTSGAALAAAALLDPDTQTCRELVPAATLNTESAHRIEFPDDARSDFVRHLHGLTGVLDDGKRIVLALAYPKPLLDRFAQELSVHIAAVRKRLAEEGDHGAFNLLGRDQADSELATTARPTFGSMPPAAATPIEATPAIGIPEFIAEVKEAIRKRAEPDVFDQPLGSEIRVEQFEDGGVTFRIPAAGVWKGSAGAFPFGVLSAAVTAGFTVLFAGAGVIQGQGAKGVLGAIGIMSLFWIVSAALLIVGYIAGTRESAIAIVGQSVMVIQTGLRGAKRREWPRSELKTARVGPSGTEINDKPVPELQLYGSKGKLLGMLAGRDGQELQWMATLLRRALKGTASSGPQQSLLDRPQDPAESNTPLGAALESAFNFEGMTIQERLQVERLTEAFAAARECGDRDAMLQLLARVQLPNAGAAAFVDALLTESRNRQS